MEHSLDSMILLLKFLRFTSGCLVIILVWNIKSFGLNYRPLLALPSPIGEITGLFQDQTLFKWNVVRKRKKKTNNKKTLLETNNCRKRTVLYQPNPILWIRALTWRVIPENSLFLRKLYGFWWGPFSPSNTWIWLLLNKHVSCIQNQGLWGNNTFFNFLK